MIYSSTQRSKSVSLSFRQCNHFSSWISEMKNVKTFQIADFATQKLSEQQFFNPTPNLRYIWHFRCISCFIFLLLHQVQGPQILQTLQVYQQDCLESFPDYTEYFKSVWKLSKVSGQFPECQNSFSDGPETFKRDLNLSRVYGIFCLDIFQSVQNLLRVSGNFPRCMDTFADCPEPFQRVQRVFQMHSGTISIRPMQS